MSPPQHPHVDIPQLARTTVYMDAQRPLQVGQLWAKQPVVLIFLRHFACIACRAHASQVWSQRGTLERSGARLVFIGNGQPHWIEGFRTDLGIDHGVVLTDPSLRSFQAAGMQHGVFPLLRPQSFANVRKLVEEGHAYGPAGAGSGSRFQMGGVLAVSRFGKVMYQFASAAVGDFPQEPYMDIIASDEGAAG